VPRALGAIAFLVAGPKTYSASASVYVIPTAADQSQGGQVANSRTSGAVNMDSQAQLIQSGTVAAAAARRLHSSLSPWALVQQVSVRVPANSAVLQINCQASSGTAAAACANAFAAAYLQVRKAAAISMNTAALRTVQGQVKTLESQAGKLTSQISSFPTNSAQWANARAQLTSVTSQLHTLSAQEARLTAQGANSSGGSVISSPGPPRNPSSPKKLLVLASGLVAGLIIGLICAFWWEPPWQAYLRRQRHRAPPRPPRPAQSLPAAAFAAAVTCAFDLHGRAGIRRAGPQRGLGVRPRELSPDRRRRLAGQWGEHGCGQPGRNDRQGGL
jgi:uncharacterized protein involved in exopolysaccharide biosynthesis